MQYGSYKSLFMCLKRIFALFVVPIVQYVSSFDTCETILLWYYANLAWPVKLNKADLKT